MTDENDEQRRRWQELADLLGLAPEAAAPPSPRAETKRPEPVKTAPVEREPAAPPRVEREPVAARVEPDERSAPAEIERELAAAAEQEVAEEFEPPEEARELPPRRLVERDEDDRPRGRR